MNADIKLRLIYVEAHGCSPTDEKTEGIPRSSGFGSGRVETETHGDVLNSNGKNVGNGERGQRPLHGRRYRGIFVRRHSHAATFGRRKISYSYLYSIIDQPEMLASEFAELEVLAVVIVDSINLSGSTADVEIPVSR